MLTTRTICIQGDSPNMIAPFFLSSIMQLLKIRFLKILGIIKDNLFKFLGFFLYYLKECHVKIQHTNWRNPILYCTFLKDNFSVHFNVLKSICERVVFELFNFVY